LGGYGLRVTPAIKERGWVAGVPTTALILVLPWTKPDESELFTWEMRNAGAVTSGSLSARARLSRELLLDRVDRKKLATWQARLLAEVCVRGCRKDGTGNWGWSHYQSIASAGAQAGVFDLTAMARLSELSQIEIKTRSRWPSGVPLLGKTFLWSWPEGAAIRTTLQPVTAGLNPIVDERIGGYGCCLFDRFPWREGLTSLGSTDGNISELRYVVIQELDYGKRGQGPYAELRRYPMSIPISIGGNAEDIMEGVDAPELTRVLQQSIHPVFSMKSCSIDIPVDQHGVDRALFRFAPLTLAVRIEVRADEAVIADGFGWWRATNADSDPASIWLEPNGTVVSLTRQSSVASGKLHVRLIGSADVALRDIESNRYWKGEVTLPLTVKP